MSGICGWTGSGVDDPAATLAAMTGRFTWPHRDNVHTRTGPLYGIAALGPSGTAAVTSIGPFIVAIQGHPLLRGAPGKPPAAIASAVAEAYATRAAGVLDDLTGEFALAVVDERDGRALLAVDRFAVRSLAYQVAGDRLIFGATTDVVNAHPLARTSVDPQALYDYVYFHMIPGPGTAYRETARVLPGHFVTFAAGAAISRRYWELRFEEPRDGSVKALAPAFRSALEEGVRDYAADERCGTFLSGGTDSSTISGIAGVVTGRPTEAWSIGFAAEGYDEMEYARIAARHFASRHHEYYVTPDDVVAAVPRIAAAYDEPFGNASAVPTYYCALRAQEGGVQRMLGGDGGDELFGGNDRYAKQQQLALFERLPRPARALLAALVHATPGARTMRLVSRARSYIEQASLPMPARYQSYNLLSRLGPRAVFTDDFLATVDPARPLQALTEHYDAAPARSLINRMLWLDAKYTLADNDLPKVTRTCEIAGVDVAFPMLHPAVVDFSRVLPPGFKLRGTRLRYFFKEALRDFLPPEIIAKVKHGFGLPAGRWLCDHAPLRELAGDALHDLRDRRIVRGDLLDELLSVRLREHAAYYGTLAWILMMLELWFRTHAAVDASALAQRAAAD